MRRLNGFILLTCLILVVIGISAIYRIVHLNVAMGKYYRADFENDTTEVKVEDRTFRIGEREDVGKRGSILADDGTILLATIFVYDLYWYPAHVSREDSALFMQQVDTLIHIFHRINPKTSVEEYNRLIKQGYLNYRAAYWEAVRKKKENKQAAEKEIAKLNTQKVIIKISNIEQPAQWVRQRDIREIDALFKGWKGKSLLRGGCQRDRKEVRRLLAGGYPSSVLGTLKKDKGENSYSYRGMEGYYDSLLRGNTVYKRTLKVNNVEVGLKENRKRMPPANGYNIKTTIDKDIQGVTRDALKKCLMNDPTAVWACAIVMEVQTGEIKAIVNLDKNGNTCEEITDHATTESMEPGSTFKLMTLLAALESKKADTATIVPCEKGGRVTLKKAFAISDNEGLYHAAKMGYPTLRQFREAFTKMGFDSNLHIETANAKVARLKTRTNQEVDYKNMTHGYSIQVPPIYMLAYYNAVANNGIYVKPTLISAMVSPNGEVIEKMPQIINRKICSPNAILLAQSCLEAVVTEGTAKKAQDEHYKTAKANKEENLRPLIAGKTGTAFIYDKKKKEYLQGIKNSSFIGYFPAKEPKYTCLVLISKTTLDAGSIAVPVCREIAEKIYNHSNEVFQSGQEEMKKKNLPTNQFACRKDMELICRELDIPVKPLATDNQYVAVVRGADSNIVFQAKNIRNNNLSASLRNATAKDAAAILEKQGYVVRIQGVGKVEEVQIIGKKAIVILN